MPKINIDLYKAREKIAEKFNNDLEESNKLWYGTIRLIITLSSSFLLLTLAVVKQLFPGVTLFNEFSYFLISAWIFLFLAIIFGIVAELDAAIFHGNSGRSLGKSLKEIDKKISQGIKSDNVDLPDNYVIDANIIWGASCINCFIIAILCLCLSFLEEIHFEYCFQTLSASIILLILLNYHLIQKRNT